VFVTRRIPDAGLDLLSKWYDVDVWEDALPPPRDALLARAAGVTGLLSLLSDSVDADVMDAAGPTLKGIANFAVGYNNIDIAAAKARRIPVGNTPDVLTDATADIAVGLLIAAARRFSESIDQVRTKSWKTWEPLGLLGQDLSNKTLGIVGMGRIGLAVAQRLRGGWGMRVLYTARSAKPDVDHRLKATKVSFDELIRESDFISIHTDLNDQTKHLFGQDALAKMKSTAVLVNTSRGGIVDQEALYAALRNQKLFAAGLDVTDPEPLPDDSRLRELPSCLILPHIGSATIDARNQMAVMAANNLIAAIEGRQMPFGVA
jgi:glyoxylate reductase